VNRKLERNISISKAVRKVLYNHPCILDSIKMEIVNYSALASKIKGEVERIIGRRNIRPEAIKMALIRFSEKLRRDEKNLENKIRSIMERSILELKGDISIMTVRQERITYKLDRIMGIADKSRFFQLTQGTKTFTLIFDRTMTEEMVEEIGCENILSHIKNQSAIIIKSPSQVLNTPGFMAYITSQLARNGINITQMVSCYEDTILIVDRSEAGRAFKILEEDILGIRSEV